MGTNFRLCNNKFSALFSEQWEFKLWAFFTNDRNLGCTTTTNIARIFNSDEKLLNKAAVRFLFCFFHLVVTQFSEFDLQAWLQKKVE